MTVPHNKRFRFASITMAGAALVTGVVLPACTSDETPKAAAAAVTTVMPVTTTASGSSGSEHMGGHATTQATAETKLYTTMRGLWDEHMEWTWNAVVAFATDSPGLQPTLDRLLRNQADIGRAITAYYGKDAGAQVTELLSEHINLAVPVLKAAKSGDKDALSVALDAWYANAQEIGDFLATANPNQWDQADMRAMMKTHIDQTTDYASKAITGDWAAAITSFDEAQAHMAEMSDMLSAGIIGQFPDKF